MSCNTRLTETFEKAIVLPLDSKSKYILFSDCHRGNGKANDNFLKNEFIYLAALQHYYRNGFTYLELGDGDELWENRSMKQIKEVHTHSFEILAKFFKEKRFYAIYGNHDMVKKGWNRKQFHWLHQQVFCAYQKETVFSKKYFDDYYCDRVFGSQPLCPDICFYSGIILKDSLNKKDIYLTHGHQASIMNSTFWKVNRFLVRYIWKNLEIIGVPDPTSAARNNTKKEETEKLLLEWAKNMGVILITGHTHRPMAGSKKSPYFNTGSCIHPSGITGIEIERRYITVVKWYLGTRKDQSVYVKREILGESICIDDYME